MANPPEAWRLFVALELPDSVREAIAAVQQQLRERGLGRLRWVRPQGIHLTLKFLGNVATGRLLDLSRALQGATAGQGALSLSTAGAGIFDERRPRVLWLGLAGDLDRLKSLQARVDEALLPLGFHLEGRPFAPHLTLARVPPAQASALKDAIRQALADTNVPEETFLSTEVSLMRSVLTREGALYNRLEAFPLT